MLWWTLMRLTREMTAPPGRRKGSWERPREEFIKIGLPAVPRLITLLRHRDWAVRRDAAYALGRIGDPSAQDPLKELLRDPDVRPHAVEALELIALGIATDLADRRDPRAVPMLVQLLGARNLADRVSSGLVQMGPLAVGALGAVVNGESASVREAAAKVLAKIGAPAVETLVGIVSKSPNAAARLAALEALVKIGDRRAKPAFAAALAAPATRRMGIKGLGRLADADTIDSILRCLDDSDDLIRAEAADALAHFNDRRVVIPIVRAARAKAYPVSAAASRALRALGELAHQDLIAALTEPELADTAATLLGEVGSPAAPALVATMRSGEIREEQGLDVLARMRLDDVHLDPDLSRSVKFRRMLNTVVDGNGAPCHFSKDHTTAYVLDTQPRKRLEREIRDLTGFVEAQAQQLSTPELQRVLGLGETHVRVQATCGSSDYNQESVDSSRLRQIARQELIRRGVTA